MEKVTGEIQTIRKDKKAIQVLGEWYQSRFKVLDDLNKGDNIEIEYTENKGFKNIKKYSVLDNEPKLTSKTESKEIPRETINTLIMAMKDIYLDVKNNDKIEDIAALLAKGYKKLISEL